MAATPLPKHHRELPRRQTAWCKTFWLAGVLSVAAASLAALRCAAQDAALAQNSQIAGLLARAQQGRAQDEVKLGVALQFGQGVSADPFQAAHWFLNTANQPDPAGHPALQYP